MNAETKRLKIEKIADQLSDLICHINPRIKKSDIRDGVAAQHLVNRAVYVLSGGNFGKHPRQLEDLLYYVHDVEDFIRCLDTVNFEIPSADELLKAMRDIKNEQPEEHIYAEKMTNGC